MAKVENLEEEGEKNITLSSNQNLAESVSGKSESVWRQRNACNKSADNITEHSAPRFKGQILKCYLTDWVCDRGHNIQID